MYEPPTPHPIWFVMLKKLQNHTFCFPAIMMLHTNVLFTLLGQRVTVCSVLCHCRWRHLPFWSKSRFSGLMSLWAMPLLCKYSYQKNNQTPIKNRNKYSNQKQKQIFLSKTEPNIPTRTRTKYSYQKQNQIFLSQKQNQIFLSKTEPIFLSRKQNQIFLLKTEPNIPVKNRTKYSF